MTGADPSVVRTLERLLAEAMSGELRGVACAAVYDGPQCSTPFVVPVGQEREMVYALRLLGDRLRVQARDAALARQRGDDLSGSPADDIAQGQNPPKTPEVLA